MDVNNRLLLLIEKLGMSSSAFAREIGVQKSSISHISSGRNKPSVEFLQKIENRFPNVSLLWLLQGKGEPFHPTSNINQTNPTLFDEPDSLEYLSPEVEKNKIDDSQRLEGKPEKAHKMESSKKEIQKIVFFYSDGSFEVFHP
ncbi:MAG: transcriptional regulator [Flavobacteriaceae bacterium]|nr:MAG: transcriptional regulator [Flavobacteriaceae bacterium]